MFRLTPVVQTLLLINIAIFAVPYLVGGGALLNEITDDLALRSFNSPKFKIYEIVTYMFMHGGWQHLFFNMLGLAFIAPMLEQVWGSQKFLLYYMVCGIGAGILYLAVNYFQLNAMQADLEVFMADSTPANFADFIRRHSVQPPEAYLDLINRFSAHRNDPTVVEYFREAAIDIYKARLDIPMVGASGAIYGVLLAFGILFPNLTMMLFPLPIPVKAKYLVLGYGAMALYGLYQNAPSDNVAHMAHLGGMVVGLALLLIWSGGRRPEQYN